MTTHGHREGLPHNSQQDRIDERAPHGHDYLTDERKVDVHVERGIVTLQGTVSSDSEAQVILNAVLNTAGVRDVRNNLETRTL